jgi:protein CpxP
MAKGDCEMKTDTKFLLGAAVVAALTMGGFFAVLAQGETTPPAGQHRPGRMLERLRDLGLTDEQKTAVKATLEKHRATIQPLMEKMMAERRTLQDLIHAEKVDESAIRAQATKVAAVEADLAIERAKIGQELRPTLTAEQIQKLQDMKRDFCGRVDEARERFGKKSVAE